MNLSYVLLFYVEKSVVALHNLSLKIREMPGYLCSKLLLTDRGVTIKIFSVVYRTVSTTQQGITVSFVALVSMGMQHVVRLMTVDNVLVHCLLQKTSMSQNKILTKKIIPYPFYPTNWLH